VLQVCPILEYCATTAIIIIILWHAERPPWQYNVKAQEIDEAPLRNRELIG
jgi:hypothetical protein